MSRNPCLISNGPSHIHYLELFASSAAPLYHSNVKIKFAYSIENTRQIFIRLEKITYEQ
jgi:hypothetical protein